MRLILTGDAFFCRRHKGLGPALAKRLGSADILPTGNILEILPFRVLNRAARGPLRQPIQSYLNSFDRKAKGYALRSQQTERKLRRLAPDYVLHLFSSFAPVWTNDQRFGMYLDFTMAQAVRQWPPWAAFDGIAELNRWLAFEKRSYDQAESIFVMGASVAASLAADYGIPERKISIVGSATDLGHPPDGERSFGSKMILFYGSEFERKGGDILLQAFGLVRLAVPDARLIVIGTDRPIGDPGVSVLGIVPQAKVSELLLQADIVAAPARCEPFTTFVVEAMNYGTPCIVTRASGISEQIDGGGVILEHLDASLLAEALISLLSNPARLRRMSASARKVIVERLNWDSVASRIAASI